ncbi:MAG: TIGR04255 family protein [Ruminococcus sp.]|jgi:uncharacterized protein (TIGR04255 family)|nr:TIGR04255 family protein [Ruminococcus sp.]
MNRPYKRVKYKNNPIVEVACQINFPDILRISKEEPVEFQEKIREKFPKYNNTKFPLLPEVFPGFTSPVKNTHIFSTNDNESSIKLSSDFIAYSVTTYNSWEDFYRPFEEILNYFYEIYRPADYTRTGIRYIDVFCRSELVSSGINENTAWCELIEPFFLGIMAEQDSNFSVVGFSSNTNIKFADETKANLVTALGKTNKTNEDVFVLNGDYYVDSPVRHSDLKSRLDSLHVHSGEILQKGIKETLHKAMGPVDYD